MTTSGEQQTRFLIVQDETFGMTMKLDVMTGETWALTKHTRHAPGKPDAITFWWERMLDYDTPPRERADGEKE